MHLHLLEIDHMIISVAERRATANIALNTAVNFHNLVKTRHLYDFLY